MIRAKKLRNCLTVSTFGKVIQRKRLASFFPDTVYSAKRGLAIACHPSVRVSVRL